jgi:glycosyltransferase involved in cell wall biosynthesis
VYNPIPSPRGIARELDDVTADGRLRVAAIGRLAPVKNLDLLVRAVRDVPNAELDIIGPTDVPEVESSLRQLIASEALGGRVRLRGPLFGEDLRRALRHIDVVAMPSKSESFGNAAVEAALLGIAVVISDRCGAAPLIETRRAGLVVPRDSHDALVAAIRRLDADRRLLAELSANGPSLREAVSPEEVAKQHLTRYQRILAGEPPLPYTVE